MSWLQIFLLLWFLFVFVWGAFDTASRLHSRSREEYDPFASETIPEWIFLVFVLAFVILPLIVLDQVFYMMGRPGLIEEILKSDDK